MIDTTDRKSRYYTSLDRAGWALATGGLIGGVLTTALAVMGGTAGPIGVVVAFMLGTLLTALAIAAVAAPLWAVLHALGWHGAMQAALVGAACGFLLFLFAQTYGFGLGDAPPSDAQTLLYRWASAAATGLIMAAVSAVTGLVMWRVAYRRLG